jgi:hypothetical protein
MMGRGNKKRRPGFPGGVLANAMSGCGRADAKPKRDLAFAACLDIEDQQKDGGDEYKQKACDKTKIINLHSCLVRKSSAKDQHLPPYQRANRFCRLNEECFKFRYSRGQRR